MKDPSIQQACSADILGDLETMKLQARSKPFCLLHGAPKVCQDLPIFLNVDSVSAGKELLTLKPKER